MKKTFIKLGVLLLVFFQIGGCTTPGTPVIPTQIPSFFNSPTPVSPSTTPSLILQTSTPSPVPIFPTITPTYTSTPDPTQTPLPGLLVFPLDTLDNKIPWLPLDKTSRPATYFFYFNLSKPPFNNALVRRAFAASIDKEAIVTLAKKYYKDRDVRPATSFTPPETLGRDLFGDVGITFDPSSARKFLEQAGYTDASKFPPITVLVNVGGSDAPGLHLLIAKEMASMWNEYLGIQVMVSTKYWGDYLNQIDTSPPEIFRTSWVADYNDPDNFLREIFFSGSDNNRGHFSNEEFDTLVDRAGKIKNPEERQELYILAERILCEEEAALIPLFYLRYNIP